MVEAEREGISELRRLLAESHRCVVFTGAGISTESGIPDFRSPHGIWARYRPIEFGELLSSEAARREYWRRGLEIRRSIGTPKPNRGHRAVAELVRRGTVAAVITQNIDGLHQAGGVPADKVIELHGTAAYATCLACGRRYELGPLFDAFERDGTPPVCPECGGIVKTATIDFGQAMPERAMARAEEETLACDLFLAVGSSLVVYPAAGFPAMAARRGAKLVILNREPTDYDRIADLVLHAEIGPTLGEAVGVE